MKGNKDLIAIRKQHQCQMVHCYSHKRMLLRIRFPETIIHCSVCHVVIFCLLKFGAVYQVSEQYLG